MATGILLLSCVDQPGIVAAVSDWVWRNGGNIVDVDQHADAADAMFFQRVEFDLEGFRLDRNQIAADFDSVANNFDMSVDVRFSDTRPRTAILSSTTEHCLVDMLARYHSGELGADLVLVASNHPQHEQICSRFQVAFHHLPVGDDPLAQEVALSETLDAAEVEFVVLARYMRILSPEFTKHWADRAINIHHSFLPAFVGANPYRQAHDRGVKLIGATAHYVTADLDQGPIITQDVTPVSHRDDVAALTRRGRSLEVAVLAEAVRAHLEHRVLVWGNRTVLFV